MARANLLIDIVRAGTEGNQEFFRRALEALITEERSKQHHVLADRLGVHLQLNGHQAHGRNHPGEPPWSCLLPGDATPSCCASITLHPATGFC
jgi:hypothetical protein